MTIDHITGIIISNLMLAAVLVAVLGLIVCAGYFVLLKTVLKGRKGPGKRHLFMGGLLAVYIIMVLGVTLLSRSSSVHGGVNLHFLSSYREALNSFNTRHWQFVILNIVMFVPLGVLLPLTHKAFRKAWRTIGAGALLSFAIEMLQLATGRGNFVLDDIFNNTLGAIIGYGIVMGVLIPPKLQKRKGWRRLAYFSPLLIVILSFTGIFFTYHVQEFGNLSIAPNHRINMRNTTVTLHTELGNEQRSYPVYKAPQYTRDTAERFAVDFFENISVDLNDLKVIDYSDSAIFQTQDRNYSLWITYLDGRYSFTDYSSYNEHSKTADIEPEILMDKLEQIGISIPKEAEFSRVDTGLYQWTVDKRLQDGQWIRGSLTCAYFDDDTIKRVYNHIVEYKEVREAAVKTELEAYNEILKGNFRAFYRVNTIGTIDVYDVAVDYQMDSKGFYQPIYVFYSQINGEPFTIAVPAMQ